MRTEATELGLAIAALIGLSVLLTVMLRWAGGGRRSLMSATAWAILGGAIAGSLLGPTVLGRIAPTHYEQWYSGGTVVRQQRDQLISRQGADLVAASHVQFDEDQRNNLRAEHERELAAITVQWRKAQWEHQRPLHLAAFGLVAMVLLFGGMQTVRTARDPRHGVLSPISIGLGAAIIPGGIAFTALTAWWNVTDAQAALAAAALAIGPWVLTSFDRQAADDAEFGGARMMQYAGRIASTLAILTAIAALWFIYGIEGLLISSVLLGLPLGWTIAGQWSERQIVARVLEFILIPALAACVSVKIEWFEHIAFWPLIVILLLSDDGRWFGAFLGAMLPGGRRALRTTRLVIGSMSSGVTQLAIAALAIHAAALPEFIVLALLAGSLVMEFTTPMRRSLVDQLNRTETEMDD